MLDETTVKRVLSAALEGGGELAELYVEERATAALRLEDSRVEDVNSGRDRGAGIRVSSGDRASYAYTNLLTESGLIEAAKTASAGLGGPGVVQEIDLRKVDGPVEHPVRRRPEEVGAAEKADALRAADDAARSAGSGGPPGRRHLLRRTPESVDRSQRRTLRGGRPHAGSYGRSGRGGARRADPDRVRCPGTLGRVRTVGGAPRGRDRFEGRRKRVCGCSTRSRRRPGNSRSCWRRAPVAS